eukprot:snap_masked-scaffold_2-processed-gene-13.30-mRNA-1 protein AED:1.00 eAED:1.00 QI:0/0/0/0/1/1/2/0/234
MNNLTNLLKQPCCRPINYLRLVRSYNRASLNLKSRRTIAKKKTSTSNTASVFKQPFVSPLQAIQLVNEFAYKTKFTQTLEISVKTSLNPRKPNQSVNTTLDLPYLSDPNEQVRMKTDPAGNIRLGLGKLDLEENQLLDNLRSVLISIEENKPSGAKKGKFIENCTISSTMSPGYRVDLRCVDPRGKWFMQDLDQEGVELYKEISRKKAKNRRRTMRKEHKLNMGKTSIHKTLNN